MSRASRALCFPSTRWINFQRRRKLPAESGRNPGGSVNLSLKAGSNTLHGSAYYYNRNEFFGATNPFTAPVKQKVRNYNYGFSAGGPFVKDKLFWFTTYEHQRFRLAFPTATATSPGMAECGRRFRRNSTCRSTRFQ